MHHLRLHHSLATKPTTKTFAVYTAVLFLSFNYFFIVYINSSFLAQFFSGATVGYLYIGGSILSMSILFNAHRILRRIGNFKFLLTLVSLQLLALFTLALSSSPILAVVAFMAQQAINPAILYCLDIILDTYSTKETQGRSRGIFLTILNAPPLLATLITGFILTGNNFNDIYLLSALFLIPLLLITFFQFKNFTDPHYKKIELSKVISRFKSNPSVRDIFIDNIVLQVFYSIMTIYLPLYLQQAAGFSLSQIAIMFSFMLLPFVIFQLPVGKIADERLGEKEFIICGFILMAISIATLGWIQTSTMWVWIAILVATRIGAAVVEITTESYFFKHVEPTDADMIGVFRMAHGIAFILTPLVGALVLYYVELQNIFIIGAIFILIVGLRYAFDLVDTK
jgi:MFS family permease